MNIRFEKANKKHEKTIFAWLEEPHMKEFWDNTQEHKDDILNFIYGRNQTYIYGTAQYWVGYCDDQAFCFILTDEYLKTQNDLSKAHKDHLSAIGHTIGLDYGIGNKGYIGQGLAAPTLRSFIEFFHKEIDPLADTFFIDPDPNNPRAKHVYEKAGFQTVGEYQASRGAFQNSKSLLMVLKI